MRYNAHRDCSERRAREAARGSNTLAQIAVETFEARKAELKNDDKAGRWFSPLELHVLPKLGKVLIEEVDQRDIRDRVPADFEVSSIVQAAEIAHIALRGTWAQASAETIRQDYNDARVQLRTDIGKEVLSAREEEFVYWDVSYVRPETLQLLERHMSI